MSILEKALNLVNGERQSDYGHPYDDFSRTAKLWSAILDIPISPEQVALCMVAVKLSREVHKHKKDNLVDIAGYAETLAMVVDEKAFRDGLALLHTSLDSS